MVKKIIIDADPGVGDALAIALALSDRNLDVLALTAVGGRVTASQAARNLFVLVEALDPSKFPRIGAVDAANVEYERARFGERYGEEADFDRRMQGEVGLGDWPVGDAQLHHPRSAAKLLVETVRESSGEVTLITLGPLTNLSLAMELDPEFPARLGGLVTLAGTLDGPGDIGPATEFNIAFQPIAAQHVFRSSATKTLLPLNIARKGVLTFDHVQQFHPDESTPRGRLLKSLLAFSLRAQREFQGMEGLWLQELVAIAAVARPELFTTQTLAMDIETEGLLTRGATVFDRRPRPRWRPNLTVITDFDVQGVIDYVSRLLSG